MTYHEYSNSHLNDEDDIVTDKPVADIVSVQVSGESNPYRFSVEILSPDTGCDQYADWWEVLSGNGELIYRRILTHSHVNEQPFVRSGGPIPINSQDIVLIRAHLFPAGYGGKVFKGTVQNGFVAVEISRDFAETVENEPPQPEGCAF